MKKEYKVFEISAEAGDTESELNRLADLGWNVVCSYASHNLWTIMEREKKADN